MRYYAYVAKEVSTSTCEINANTVAEAENQAVMRLGGIETGDLILYWHDQKSVLYMRKLPQRRQEGQKDNMTFTVTYKYTDWENVK